MKLTDYDEKENVLYIRSQAILPDTTQMTRQEQREAYEKWFAMGYEKRIDLSPYKDQIKAEIAKHEGCKLSEFTAAFC